MNSILKIPTARTLAGLCLLSLATTPALAQEPAAAPVAAGDGGLDEIFVTAEKREGTEQTTPISMTVLTPELLERNGVGNLESLTAIAPSVNFARNNTSSIITIRGVSSRDTTEVGDPAISVNIDGLYLQRSIGLNESVFDLERVEVLRGPQGTLYGRNSTGGTINFITAKPQEEFQASAAVGFGTYDLLTTEGMLNVPLSDTVQLRAAFQTRDHAGYRSNGLPLDGDDADSQAARISLAFQPTDKLTGLISAELVTLGGVGPAVYGTPFILEDADDDGDVDDVVHEKPALPADGDAWPLSNTSGYLDVTSTMLRWNLDYALGFADVIYLGGYRKLDYHGLIDLDGTESQQFYFQQNEKPETWNHELRLASTGDGPLEWQVGLYYFKEQNDLLTFFQTYDDPVPPVDLFTFTYPVLKTTSKAVFAQGSWAVLDNLKLTLGARYSEDDKTRVGSLDFGTGILQQNASSSDSQPTYTAGVDWQVTDDSLLYAKFSTGYKAGGFTDAAPYDPETIDAFEIGSKNRFMEDRLQLNAAAFYYDYTDQQVSQFIGTQTLIRNAGKSEIYGVELEGRALVTDADRIDFYLGYLQAEYKDFDTAPEDPDTGDLSGNTPPQSPDWSANFGYEHEFPVGDGALTARIQAHYEGDSNFSFFNTNSTKQDSFTRSDIILSYTPSAGNWMVDAYVRNLEDEAILTQAEEQSLYGNYIYQFADPRTAGVRFKVNW